MNSGFFSDNRKAFIDQMSDNSVAVFYSGQYLRDTNDQLFHPFSVERNFFYFTGLSLDNLALVMTKTDGKTSEILFIPPVDEHFEKWQGRMLRPAEATETSGIKQVFNSYELEHILAQKISAAKRVYLFGHIAEFHEALTPAMKLAQKVRDHFPHVKIKNSLEIMTRLRGSKTPEEIEKITEAVNLAGDGLAHTMKLLRPGIYEYQVKAHYIHYLSMAGFGPRHRSVVASGKNATVLHYNDANRQIVDGDMVLMDVGASCGWYVSDITRTYPVNGKFTDKQRQVYDILLEALDIALGTIRVGISEDVVQAAILKHFGAALKALGLISDPSEAGRYYFHGSGHPIGLDLHDLRSRDKLIPANQVHTVEPGLYIPEWNMGIRIEDNVVVKKGGVVNLSAHVLKTANDIENFMA